MMEQPGVVAGNFALSFSLKFSSIFVHISGSMQPVTLIWTSMERCVILVKRDDVRSGRKAEALHGRLQPAWESMG